MAIGAVRLQLVTAKTVTAEAAGSSPVVPAIHSQELTESAPVSRGHKKAQNRYTKLSLVRQSSRLARFLWAQERDNRILRIALLGRNRLSVRIERHPNRGVTRQFLHDFQFRTGGSKQCRIGVTTMSSKTSPLSTLPDYVERYGQQPV